MKKIIKNFKKWNKHFETDFANENHSEAITSHLSEWLSSKGQIRSLVQDAEKWKFLGTTGGSVNWCREYGK